LKEREDSYMKIRLNTGFISIRCTLRKMQPGVALICGNDSMSLGWIDFENHRLIYTGINYENLKSYKLIKK